MDFNLSEEQRLLVNSAERYVRDKYGFDSRRAAHTADDGFSREHWSRFAEMGWLALPLPEDAGGLGGTLTDLTLLLEPLGGALVAEPVVDTVVLAATLIAGSDNAGLRERLLGAIGSGAAIVALAHMEADGRSEYQTPVAARARRQGDGWIVNGVKVGGFHAAADTFLVSARLDDGDGFAIFAVPHIAAGLTLSSYRLIDGTRAAELVLSDVAVAADGLLLAPDRAASALEAALDGAVIALGAIALGSMETVMAMTADYLKQRVQYGQPLASFQALQHRMAEMFVETDQARSALCRALAASEGDDAELRRRAVSGAKVLVARAGLAVAGQGIQLHGGIGTTDELAVGHHYKAAVVFDRRFGESDFHLARSIGLGDGNEGR